MLCLCLGLSCMGPRNGQTDETDGSDRQRERQTVRERKRERENKRSFIHRSFNHHQFNHRKVNHISVARKSNHINRVNPRHIGRLPQRRRLSTHRQCSSQSKRTLKDPPPGLAGGGLPPAHGAWLRLKLCLHPCGAWACQVRDIHGPDQYGGHARAGSGGPTDPCADGGAPSLSVGAHTELGLFHPPTA